MAMHLSAGGTHSQARGPASGLPRFLVDPLDVAAASLICTSHPAYSAVPRLSTTTMPSASLACGRRGPSLCIQGGTAPGALETVPFIE